MAHRATACINSHKFTPFHIFFGREMRVCTDTLMNFTPTQGTGDVNSYMRTMEEKIKILHQLATENIKTGQEMYKKQYDKKALPCKFSPGEKAWLKSPSALTEGTSKKMQILFNKLIEIKEQIGENTFIVRDPETKIEIKGPVHIDNLRKFRKDILHESEPETESHETSIKDKKGKKLAKQNKIIIDQDSEVTDPPTTEVGSGEKADELLSRPEPPTKKSYKKDKAKILNGQQQTSDSELVESENKATTDKDRLKLKDSEEQYQKLNNEEVTVKQGMITRQRAKELKTKDPNEQKWRLASIKRGREILNRKRLKIKNRQFS
jgi:hypothetical protein